jgi:hypothetical protein
MGAGLRLNSEADQNRAQYVRSEDPVAVVIAKDRNPLLVTDGRQYAFDCVGDPWNRRGIGKIVPGRGLDE